MGAFTKNVSSEMAFFEIIGWLWTPPQMLAIRYHNGACGLGGLFLITLVWSSLVGIAFGFILPWFSFGRRGPDQPASSRRYGR